MNNLKIGFKAINNSSWVKKKAAPASARRFTRRLRTKLEKKVFKLEFFLCVEQTAGEVKDQAPEFSPNTPFF